MAGFIEGVCRDQTTLFPVRLDDWIGEDHLARVVDLFVDQLDLTTLGFQRHVAARTGRPGYHPAVLLKLFINGYLNRIPSSRRLEVEAGRNVELMWLTGSRSQDHRGFPATEWPGHSQDLCAVRGIVPPDRCADGRRCRGGWQQIQSC